MNLADPTRTPDPETTAALSSSSVCSLVRMALDEALDPVYIHRPDGTLIYWNYAAAENAGRMDNTVDDVPAWGWSEAPESVRAERLKLLESQGLARFNCHQGDDYVGRDVEVSARWVETTEGPVIISVERDISERAEAERALRDMAFKDPLTGLANRAMLEDRLKLAIANARRHHDTLGVLFIDLDDFKPVNDTHGHAIGDFLLKAVAERMAETVRTEDTVARVGGDEFVIVLPRLRGTEGARLAADKIRNIVSKPFTVGEGVTCQVTATIGYALFDPEHDDAHTLLIRADLAMYHARQTGTDVAGAEPLE